MNVRRLEPNRSVRKKLFRTTSRRLNLGVARKEWPDFRRRVLLNIANRSLCDEPTSVGASAGSEFDEPVGFLQNLNAISLNVMFLLLMLIMLKKMKSVVLKKIMFSLKVAFLILEMIFFL